MENNTKERNTKVFEFSNIKRTGIAVFSRTPVLEKKISF